MEKIHIHLFTTINKKYTRLNHKYATEIHWIELIQVQVAIHVFLRYVLHAGKGSRNR